MPEVRHAHILFLPKSWVSSFHPAPRVWNQYAKINLMNTKSEQTSPWRVVVDSGATGAWNMALDEAIATLAGEGKSPPTLRLYQWSPGCLSLGRAQPYLDVDIQGIRQHGWDVVRRPSGGRAILHIDELTYCFTASLDAPLFHGDILESYHRIAAGLILFLKSLGVDADMNRNDAGQPSGSQNPICFEVPSQYEITWQGKKVIGSAQARKGSHVLQHGSIPIFGDITRIVDALAYPDETEKRVARSKMAQRATTLQTASGEVFDWGTLVTAFLQAQTELNGLTFVYQPLTSDELHLAEKLMNDKYASPEWNQRI